MTKYFLMLFFPALLLGCGQSSDTPAAVKTPEPAAKDAVGESNRMTLKFVEATN